ncbi:hypothetical protein HD806DRAFT_509656 [Xylariaceae sp. AK1471]|nr:hypothetical protein HD806DRAFT_509656 [Xylariaceae sp. AK1471]
MIPTMQRLGLHLLAAVPFTTAIYPGYPTDGCPTCAKPKHCSNEGWDWAYYPNPIRNTADNYPGFRADVFKTIAPTYANVTPVIGELASVGGGGTFYNSSSTLNSSFFALNQHAYLWACEKGTWTFNISNVDDLVLAWVGDKAYSGWTDDNADARAVFLFENPGRVGSANFAVDLDGGAFVPIRFVLANAQGDGGSFRLNITSPSGIVVHQSGRETDNGWIVRSSCFAPEAPLFPAFGKEQ